MSPKFRQQHKPGRDGASKSKELADARRENSKLARENARLKKLAARAVDSNDMFRSIDRGAIPMPEMKGCIMTRDVLQDAVEKMMGACACGGQWKRLELGPKVIEVCVGCAARRSVKTDPI